MPHILSNHAVLLAGGQGGGQEYAAGDNINITDHVISGKDWTSTIESAVRGKEDQFTIGQNLMWKSNEYFSAILDLNSTGCSSAPYSYAIAVGQNNLTNNNSIVAGKDNRQYGYNSIVFGASNSADNTNQFGGSIVGGQDNNVRGVDNIAVGREIAITGNCNAVFGYDNSINGNQGFIAGIWNHATNGSHILGEGNSAFRAIVIGYNCCANAASWGTQEVPYVIGGYQCSAGGENAVTIGGRWNKLSGDESFIMGTYNEVTGMNSIAIGDNNYIEGNGYQHTYGDSNSGVSGWLSYTYGYSNDMRGQYLCCYGSHNTGTSAAIDSLIFGHRNEVDSPGSHVYGRQNELHGTFGECNNYVFGYWNDLNGTTSALAVGFHNNISNVTGAIAVGEQLSPGQDEMHIGFQNAYIKIDRNGDVYKMINGVETPWADLTAGVYSAGQNIDITNYVISGRDWSTEIGAATGNITATVNNNFELNASNKITGYNGTAFEVGGGGGVPYTAGQNINITNNIISGRDWSSEILDAMNGAIAQTTYSAGDNINISNNVISGKNWSTEISNATTGKENKITYTYSNSKITALNGSAIAQKEYAGVAPISVNNSTNQISLAQSAMNVLTSFAGKYNLKAGNGISFRLVGNDVYIDAT